MKALKISEDQFECLIADAIFYKDNSYSSIKGDWINGFVFSPKQSIEKVLENEWAELFLTLEDKNKEFIVIAGETTCSGTGFVAVKSKKTGSFKWLMQSSKFNHPFYVQIERGNSIRLTTDLNFPYGVDFVIPIDKPHRLKSEDPMAHTKSFRAQ